MESNEQREEGKKRISSKVVIITLSLLVIILLSVIGWLLLSGGLGSKEKVVKGTKDVPALIGEDDDVDDILSRLEENAADTRFNCRMTYKWSFAGTESENAYIANTELNHYPLWFEVVLDDTQETVYTSKLIPVGYEVKGITLDKRLSAGEYPATVMYHLVDDNDEEVSSVGFTITIRVE